MTHTSTMIPSTKAIVLNMSPPFHVVRISGRTPFLRRRVFPSSDGKQFLRAFDPSGSPASLIAKGLRPVHVGHALRVTPFRHLDLISCQALAMTFAGDAEGHGGD